MKILYISSNIPHHKDIGGEYIRTANQVRELVQHGHEVRVLCLRPEDQLPEFAEEISRTLGIVVEHYPQKLPRRQSVGSSIVRKIEETITGKTIWDLNYDKGFAQRVKSTIADFSPDVVHVESHQMGVYGQAISSVPAIWFLADSVSLVIERKLESVVNPVTRWRLVQSRRAKQRFDQRWARFFGVVFFVANEDRDMFLKRHSDMDVRVAANGIDLVRYRFMTSVRASASETLLFTGNFGAPHNRDAALFFLRQVWPTLKKRRPQARYYAAGAGPPKELRSYDDGDRVNITGFVPSLIPYFERAKVYVCTIVNGAGMLNKLQEAMALGVPVVCTTQAARGLRLQHGIHALVADTPGEIVMSIEDILDNQAASIERAINARKFMEAEYTWAAHIEKLEGAYADVIADQRISYPARVA